MNDKSNKFWTWVLLSVFTPILTGVIIYYLTEGADLNSENPVTEPIQFYFLADTAFIKIDNAKNEIRKLKNLGYNQAGKFWLQDYPNLSNNPYYQVYVAKFSSRTSCIELLKSYIQRNQDAYCALASTNQNVSPDYFGSDSLQRSRNP